jgi:hypothetical protein
VMVACDFAAILQQLDCYELWLSCAGDEDSRFGGKLGIFIDYKFPSALSPDQSSGEATGANKVLARAAMRPPLQTAQTPTMHVMYRNWAPAHSSFQPDSLLALELFSASIGEGSVETESPEHVYCGKFLTATLRRCCSRNYRTRGL